MPNLESGISREPRIDSSVQDSQGRWREMLSPSNGLNGAEQPSVMTTNRTKCHGNRKLRHFKRKWRARGLNDQAIQALIQARQQQQKQQSTHEQRNSVAEKRKRDRSTAHSVAHSVKSLSQLSISQRSSKKHKEMSGESLSMDDALSDVGEIDLRLNKYSKYLKMPQRLLLRSLRLQLDHRLKKEIEQNYILRRLHLLDEHFCVDRIRHLYQSYLDLGTPDRTWPVSCCLRSGSERKYAFLFEGMRSEEGTCESTASHWTIHSRLFDFLAGENSSV